MTRSVKMNVNTGVLTLQQFRQNEIERETSKLNMMRKLSTFVEFYKFYFENLPNYKSTIDCFNVVNKLYCDLFGEKRFYSFETFTNRLNLA